MTRGLTARGVKTMLTRSGVATADLAITDQVETVQRIDVDYVGPWVTRNSVIITGEREARRPASGALFERGFACAPYPDHDFWTR